MTTVPERFAADPRGASGLPDAGRIEQESRLVGELMNELGRVIVGQRAMLERLLIGLLADGHVLLEGVPGLAKTLSIRTLAATIAAQFHRIQFTPDLLPADLIGTMIYNQRSGDFTVQKGPIFTNLLLADEINRAPAKVQSALLEAMQEKQVTIGGQTFPLPELFLVLATQNPIEHEGTYPLPEAQVDRFLLKLVVPYPEADEEREIVARDERERPTLRSVTDGPTLARLREQAGAVHVAPAVSEYAVRLARATREPALAGAQLAKPQPRPAAGAVAVGASPRATIFLVRAARARALLDGRSYATPHDVKRVAPDVLRHRVLLSYEAEADGIRPEDVVAALLQAVEIP
jgi:MoxR-like ATPase